MIRCEPNPDNAHVPWLYKGSPCEVVALGVEGGVVTTIFIRAKDNPSEEIACYSSADGTFADLQYGKH